MTKFRLLLLFSFSVSVQYHANTLTVLFIEKQEEDLSFYFSSLGFFLPYGDTDDDNMITDKLHVKATR
jgi:hypothetical protein